MTAVSVEEGPHYRDKGLPLAERVADLLERMSTEEKVAQLGSAWVFELTEGEQVSPAAAGRVLGLGIGQITRVSGASSLQPSEAARIANEIQRFLVDETRLGIPAIVHEEVCAGLMARAATVFPQAIGVAATWDPALAGRMADVVRREMRAIGAHQGLSPVLDICRDPRWGRTEETYGEDPHLVARMGTEFVRGLQGEDLSQGVIATAKHFVGYGASEGGLNWAPAHIGARELHDVYLHPFEAAVRTAGLRSIMNAYNELDGIPCGADGHLLTDILRGRWGFEGCVVSDYFSVRQLTEYHRLTPDAPSAAAIAINAGMDVELPGTDCFGDPLHVALAAGAVSETVLDEAVRRVLTAKFELGLFDDPYVDPDRASLGTRVPDDLELAGEVARKSLVLLKNDGILPLRPGLRVAVIGPNADQGRHLLGDYSYPAHVESLRETRSSDNVFHIPLRDDVDLDSGTLAIPTVLDALRQRLGDLVGFAAGCDVGSGSTEGFDEAVALASGSDVAVLVMGDKAGLTSDCTSGEGRDTATLHLPGAQEGLMRAVLATGTPVVLVLVSGRPSGSPAIHEASAAVLHAWLPGEAGAAAIADALIGAVNPGGKLPVSYPRDVGQVPVFYGHKVSGGRSHWKGDYVETPAAPLYPFGHGLSYTTFELSSPAIETPTVAPEGTVTVTVTLTNTGDRPGDEVVQVYIRDPIASLTRPVLELKAFARVGLQPGESTRLAFSIPMAQLGFHDRDLRYVVEPGEFEVFVGTSSGDPASLGSLTLPGDGPLPVEQAFEGTVRLS